MKKLLWVIFAMLGCLVAAAQQSTIYGPNFYTQLPTPTYTFVDDGTNFACTGTTCSVTLTSTTANSILVALALDSNFPSTRTLTTGTGVGGTWIPYAAANATISSLWYNSLAYNLTGTGGSTSVTMTLSSSSSSWDLFVGEWKCTANCTGVSPDGTITPVASATCNNNCSGPTWTGLTGSSDLLIAYTSFNGSASSVNNSYNWASAPASYALGSVTSPATYTLTGNTDWIATGIAFTAQSVTATYASETPSFNALNLVNLTQPLNVTNCWMYIGSKGTVGDKLDCIITQQTSFGTANATAACHATYTETATYVNGWVNLPLTGCTLAAGYWYVGYNTNDAGIGQGTWSCYLGTTVTSTSCLTGSTNQSNTGNSGSYYSSTTYGTYTGMGTTMTQINNYQQAIYIVGTPTTNVPVGKRPSIF